MRIKIIATRIAGNDGVSLEAERWREILRKMGHKVTFVAGELDRSGILLPELHFNSPEVVDLYDKVVYGNLNFKKVEKDIFTIAGKIEGSLRQILNNGSKCDFVITPNVLSLPMNFPFAVALSRVLQETQIPAIARNHDFWWERKRFLKSSMFPFFKRFFPPNLPNLRHVVINSHSQKELRERVGIDSEIIWDCFNFNSKANQQDPFSAGWRKDFGIAREDIVFLQATRIVPRKRIEIAVDFVKAVNNPRAILVIAGHSGDEGVEYEKHIRVYAKKAGIRHMFIGGRISARRKVAGGRRIYSLWDCFVNADFVTYPTELEGFGNQFVEAVYFKKPVIITPYPVFTADIEPLGFETIQISEKSNKKGVEQVCRLIANPVEYNRLTEKNFELGRRYFSYEWVEGKLAKMFAKMGL